MNHAVFCVAFRSRCVQRFVDVQVAQIYTIEDVFEGRLPLIRFCVVTQLSESPHQKKSNLSSESGAPTLLRLTG